MATRATVLETERHWLRVLGTLNEYQTRLYVAQKALELGRGGIARLAALTDMARPTIAKGIAELQGHRPLLPADAERIRQLGGGRRRVEAVDPDLQAAAASDRGGHDGGRSDECGEVDEQVHADDRGGAAAPRPPRVVGHGRAGGCCTIWTIRCRPTSRP
jgi:hypothetical protein